MFLTQWLPLAASALQICHALPQQIPFSAPLQDLAQRYAGHTLVRLETAQNGLQSSLQLESLDVWRSYEDAVEVVLPPTLHASDLGFNATTLLPDLSEAIHQSLNPSDPAANTDIHSLYHSLPSLQAIFSMIAADYPHLINKFSLGQSCEGRPIDALRLSTGPSQTGRPKPQILIVGGQHAREWITVSSALFLAHTMVTELAHPDYTREEVKTLVQAFDFVFVPCLNPDGYEFSWTEDRLWRKSRQTVSDQCQGIDLNRNWGHAFTTPQRPNPCLDSWPGSEAFEAVELQGLRDYIQDAAHHIVGFIDLHSFGQMLLIPWSSDCANTVKDYEDLTEAALGAAKRAEGLYGKDFEVGQACEVNYVSTGEATDWTYGNAGIKWSFAANLRDLGTHGFLIPPDQIRPTGEEAMEMLLSLGSFIKSKVKV